jgi:cyclopropane fatty-acyl-phospholipid synthase-like methyltransferase
MTSTPYDHIAGSFSELRTTLQPKEEEYLSLLVENTPPGSLILDLGCGTGQPIAAHLTERGFDIVGVDGSAAMLEMARAALPEYRWIHERIESVDFTEKFEAIICWDALFHLPRHEHEAIIQKMYRWLLPAGRMMVSSGGIVTGNEGFTDTMFGHEFFYDSLPPEEMVAAIQRAGFDIVLAEMCNLPDGERDKGKWATLAEKRH